MNGEERQGKGGEAEARRGRLWPLVVTGTEEITPRMRRVHFTGADLGELASLPGQELILRIPDGPGETVPRHYSIRHFDPATRRLAIDFVLHGDTPAGRWVRAARAGDRIDATGPRGRVVPRPEAEWHLLAGDETALPSIFAIIEALPDGARVFAFVEIMAPDDRQDLTTGAEVSLHWHYRDGEPAGSSERLIAALEAFPLPPGRGHAYLVGETRVVRAQRQGLLARGLAKEQISADGYWRPGRLGGHDKIDRDEAPPEGKIGPA